MAEYDFTRVAFAGPMREAMLRLNPMVDFSEEHGPHTLSEIVAEMGWDNAKRRYSEIRRLLQVFGTEVGREMFGANFWVDLAMRQASQFDRVVITDCRFENEAQAIREAGGIVIRIARPGIGPVNGHVSDKGLPDDLIDGEIVNDGTLGELAAKVRALL